MELRFTVYGAPRTKKNSQQLIHVPIPGKNKSRTIPIPSADYKKYSEDFMWQIPSFLKKKIDKPINLKCVYYMPTRRRVDLTNLNEAVHDILVDSNVLADDNRDVIASTDGCRVFYDKLNPRVEITISDYDGDYEQWSK